MLSNFQLGDQALLQSFLVGQPEFRAHDAKPADAAAAPARHRRVPPRAARRRRDPRLHRASAEARRLEGRPAASSRAPTTRIYTRHAAASRGASTRCATACCSPGYPRRASASSTRDDVDDGRARDARRDGRQRSRLPEPHGAPPADAARRPGRRRARPGRRALQLDAKSVDEASRLLAKMQSDPHRGAPDAPRAPRGHDRRAAAAAARRRRPKADSRGDADQEASQAMMRDPWPPVRGPVLCVVGARPNFMKMAPILRALAAHAPPLPAVLVHTGQHYDVAMNDRLFADLELPAPDINLEVGSGIARGADRRGDAPLRAGARRAPARRACSSSATSTRRWPCTPGRGQEGRAGRARRSRPAQLRPRDAGGDQPRPDRPDRRPALHDRAQRRTTTSRAKASTPTRVAFRRQRDDRLAARQPARGASPPAETLRARRRRPVALRPPRGYGVVTLHRPSNVDDAGRAAERCSTCCATSRARLPLVWRAASAHARQHRALRPRGRSCPGRASRCCRRRATSRCSA